MIIKQLTEELFKKIDAAGYKTVDDLTGIRHDLVRLTKIVQKGTGAVLAIRYSFPSRNPYESGVSCGRVFTDILDAAVSIERANYKLD